MQRFQFRLETLLKFRRIQKEQMLVKFAQALKNLLAEQTLLTTLQSQLTENMNILRDRQQQSQVTLEIIKIFHNYFDKLKGDIVLQSQRVEEAEKYRKECLNNLREAIKNYKLVEKLREKRLAQYQTDALREEQKILDEIAIQNYTKEYV